MTIEFVGDGNPDGTCFGQSGEKIAFLGGTPTVKATLTTLASSASIATTTSVLIEVVAELKSKGFIG